MILVDYPWQFLSLPIFNRKAWKIAIIRAFLSFPAHVGPALNVGLVCFAG
jgi:hypothetical protein